MAKNTMTYTSRSDTSCTQLLSEGTVLTFILLLLPGRHWGPRWCTSNVVSVGRVSRCEVVLGSWRGPADHEVQPFLGSLHNLPRIFQRQPVKAGSVDAEDEVAGLQGTVLISYRLGQNFFDVDLATCNQKVSGNIESNMYGMEELENNQLQNVIPNYKR